MPEPAPEPGSFTRALVAVVALVGSVVVSAAGFVLMVSSLQGGGYGTRAMAGSLVTLAIGGGLMALGVALLIWEMSVRYGVRR